MHASRCDYDYEMRPLWVTWKAKTPQVHRSVRVLYSPSAAPVYLRVSCESQTLDV